MNVWSILENISTDQKTLLGLLIFNLVGVVFLVITNVIKLIHERRLHREKLRVEKEINYLQDQLSILYGPIYSLLKSNQLIKEELSNSRDALHQYQRDLLKEVIIPNNEKIVSLMQGNFHLVTGREFLDSFLKFIVHVEWQKVAGKKTGDYSSDIFRFPVDFANEIYATTEKLKMNLAKLLNQNEINPSVIRGESSHST